MKVGSKVSLHPVDPGRDRTQTHGRDEGPRFMPCHEPAIHRLAGGPCLPQEVTSQILGPRVQPDRSRKAFLQCHVGSDFKTLTLSTEACHGR